MVLRCGSMWIEWCWHDCFVRLRNVLRLRFYSNSQYMGKKMMTSAEMRKTLSVIKAGNFHSPDQFENAGIILTRLGRGFDREVFGIKDTPWAVKFGFNRNEIQAIRELRTNPQVRAYLPALIWHDSTTYCLITLRYEVPGVEDYSLGEALVRKVGPALRSIKSNWVFSDIHERNVGVDAKGRVKVIDCGAFWKYVEKTGAAELAR